MMSLTKRSFVVAVAGALTLAACSGDSGSTNKALDAGADAQQQDAATSADVGSADAGVDIAPDTGTTADTGSASQETIWVPDFTYQRPLAGAGVSVNVINGRIGKIENGNSRTVTMTDAQINGLTQDILTKETRDKMLNGWDCGDSGPINGQQWQFEARVLTDPDTNQYSDRINIDVTGCAVADSTEPDAARVQEIIQYLDNLRDNAGF